MLHKVKNGGKIITKIFPWFAQFLWIQWKNLDDFGPKHTKSGVLINFFLLKLGYNTCKCTNNTAMWWLMNKLENNISTVSSKSIHPLSVLCFVVLQSENYKEVFKDTICVCVWNKQEKEKENPECLRYPLYKMLYFVDSCFAAGTAGCFFRFLLTNLANLAI